MSVRLLKIEVENFFSLGSASLDLSEKKLRLVVGRNLDGSFADSNGSAKSALFVEAPAFTLFGRCVRGSLLSKDVIRRGQDRFIGKVSFIKNDRTYEVVRTQTQKLGTLRFYCNGEDVSKDKRETQALINDVLGLDFNMFCQSVILGQDSLNFSSASDTEKKALLERFLGIEEFGGYKEDMTKQKEALELKIQETETKKNSVSISIGSAKERLSDLLKQREHFEVNKQNRIEEIGLEILSLKNRIVAREDLDSRKAILSAKLETRPRAESSVSDLNVRLAEIRTTLSGKNSEVYKLNSRMNSLQIKIDNMETACPNCKRDYDPDSLKASRESYGTEHETVGREIAQIQGSMIQLETDKEKLTQEVDQRTAGLSAFNEIQRELDGVQADLAKILVHEDNVKMWEAQRSSVYGSEFLQETDISKLENGIRTSQTEEATLVLDLEKLAKEVPYIDFWIEGWGNKGLKSFIMDSVLGYLNDRASIYSRILMDEQIEIVFSTQKQLQSGASAESFTVSAINRFGADVYAGNSSGERQRVDLCVALTLQDLARTRTTSGIDLLVMDEACSNMDISGSQRVMQLLRELRKEEGRNVIFITHSDYLKDQFEDFYIVQKQNGESSLVNEGTVNAVK